MKSFPLILVLLLTFNTTFSQDAMTTILRWDVGNTLTYQNWITWEKYEEKVKLSKDSTMVVFKLKVVDTHDDGFVVHKIESNEAFIKRILAHVGIFNTSIINFDELEIPSVNLKYITNQLGKIIDIIETEEFLKNKREQLNNLLQYVEKNNFSITNINRLKLTIEDFKDDNNFMEFLINEIKTIHFHTGARVEVNASVSGYTKLNFMGKLANVEVNSLVEKIDTTRNFVFIKTTAKTRVENDDFFYPNSEKIINNNFKYDKKGYFHFMNTKGEIAEHYTYNYLNGLCLYSSKLYTLHAQPVFEKYIIRLYEQLILSKIE